MFMIMIKLQNWYIVFEFQFVLAAVFAAANAGLIASHGYAAAPIAVAHAPIAVAHAPIAVKGVATSYQNSNSLSVHPVAVAHAVHAAPAVAVHAAPAIVAAPAVHVGHGYALGGHGYALGGHGLALGGHYGFH